MSNPIRVLQPTSDSAAATDSTDLGDLIEKTFRREVEGALRLLDFAVADGRGVPDTVVDTIATTVKNVAPGTVTEYAGFLKAYPDVQVELTNDELRARDVRQVRPPFHSRSLEGI